MAIKIFPKGSGEQLSEHFKVSEFACHGDGCCTETKVDGQLVARLQQIRDHFGAPVTISSGYRCKAHNTAIGGAKASRHMEGMAADIKVKGVEPAEVAKYAESIGILGIGLYDTFVHVDTRTSKAFWYGHGCEYRSTFGGSQAAQEPEKEQTEAPINVDLPVLRKGDKGETVEALQILLMGRGYDLGKWGADGHYGSATENAVMCFQEDMELENRDGTVGASEWRALLGL